MVAMGASWEGQTPWLMMRQSSFPNDAMALATRVWPSSMVSRDCWMGVQRSGPPSCSERAKARSVADW